jgi:hypothetical protein
VANLTHADEEIINENRKAADRILRAHQMEAFEMIFIQAKP